MAIYDDMLEQEMLAIQQGDVTAEDLRPECKYAKKYKAMQKPTCGCKFCNDAWDAINK